MSQNATTTTEDITTTKTAVTSTNTSKKASDLEPLFINSIYM